MPTDPELRAAVEAFEAITRVYIKRHEKSLLTAVPSARTVELPGLGPVKISRRQTG